MNILPINNNPSFNGRIITRGTWTKNLKKTFIENPEVQKLASGEMNIVGDMSHRKYFSFIDRIHSFGEDTYKLKLYAEKENPTLLEKIKNFFGFNNALDLTLLYHKEESTIEKINRRIKAHPIKRVFGLE